MNSSNVLADIGDKSEYVVQKDENAWRIVFNLTKSYKKASQVDNLVVYPGDRFIISDEGIVVTRDGKEIFYTSFNFSRINKQKTKSEKKSQHQLPVDEEQTKVQNKKQPQTALNEKSSREVQFVSMTIEERFKQVVRLVNNGYYEINFPDNLDTEDIHIEDIIPEKYSYVTIVKDAEKFRKNKRGRTVAIEDNYFDILRRRPDGTFSSIFSGKKYNGSYKPVNGYLLKLEQPNYDFEDLGNPIINPNVDPGGYNNEMAIRSLYGKLVSKFILEYLGEDSIIDETFFYSIIARESSFDPNAVSWFGTRGLCMVTGETVLHILEENKDTLDDVYRERNIKLAQFNSDVITGDYELPNFDNKHMEFLVELGDFIPVGREVKLSTNGRKSSLKGLGTKLYDPEISILLALNYLKSLEDVFSFVKDKQFRRDLITVSYNMGRGIPRYIVKKDSSVRDLSGLISRLNDVANRTGMFKDTDLFAGLLTHNKITEAKDYVKAINRFDRELRKDSQDYAIASN
ncbi:MAG: transglycosylase SLT domain-containing protein [Candidatus Gracilibacteria bacterium]|nr:transglycosylase SLT domain-containing protein [Candidatus Gracilibacteria bacterium]